MENKYIVAVSGGPDSMFLLNKLNKEKVATLIVAHVNYHFRNDSNIDEYIVKKYCYENNLIFRVMNVNEKDIEKYSWIKNKQSKWRKLRYDFFNSIAIEFKTNILYVAHQKDDFIETALMQKKRSDKYFFYGIKDKNYINKLEVRRPLLNFYKSEILENIKVPFSIDSTNNKPIYERNKIRLNLKQKNINQKNEIYNYFNEINKNKKLLNNEIEKEYQNFILNNNSWVFFNKINDNIKPFLIYKILINLDKRINISSNKINSIIDFLKTKNSKKNFRLMENIYLKVKEGKIIIYNI